MRPCSSCCSVTKSYLTFVTPWAAAHQASLTFTISWSLLKLMSIGSVIPSKHPILCRPLLLLPSSFPNSGSFPMSRFFASGGQNTGQSAAHALDPGISTRRRKPLPIISQSRTMKTREKDGCAQGHRASWQNQVQAQGSRCTVQSSFSILGEKAIAEVVS